MSRPLVIEYTWPPVMPNRSPKLKELLTGNPECANETLYRTMEEYGIDKNKRHYLTEEIIQQIKTANEGAGVSFSKYQSQSNFSKGL